MTKKLAKLFGIGLLCFSMFFTGCGSNGIPALEGGPAKEAAVESQSGAIVKKGNYVYYVNGSYDSLVSPDFGSKDANEQGYIYRAELDEDGAVDTESVQLLCPKQVYTATEDSGLFISGDRIYFGAVSTHRDKRGDLLTNYLDLYTVKLDGTDCREIAYLTSNSNTSRWLEKDGKAYFVYIDSSEGVVKSIDQDGKVKTVAEDYVGTPIIGDLGNNYVYYSVLVEKPNQEDVAEDEKRYESYYEVYRASIDNGDAEKILAADSEVIQSKNAITLTKVENGVLYYTYTSGEVNYVCAYGLENSKVAQLSSNSLTVHKYFGFDEDGNYKGVIATYESKLFFIRRDTSLNGGYELVNLLQNETMPSTILTIDGEYLYYTDGSALYRVKIGSYGAWETHSSKEKIFGGAIDTSTVKPEIIGDYVYFKPTSTAHPTYANYLYAISKDTVITDDMDEEDISNPILIGKLTKTDSETFEETQEELDEENAEE